MLVIEDNSVYEIDEECIKKRKVPGECHVQEKLLQESNGGLDRFRERQEDNVKKV